MASFRIVACLAATVQASQVGPVHEARSAAFDGFRQQYAREYAPGSDEYAIRSALFHERLAFIQTHNSMEERLWTAATNKLADRTEQELASLRGWVNIGGASGGGGYSLLESDVKTMKAKSLKTEVDWRSLSMASDVPDQGSCGSCWAVATASMLRGRAESQMKVNRTFSAQQLVNCVPNPQECGGTGGCSGATVELAMAYVEEQGLTDESDTPYHGLDQTCNQPASASLNAASMPAKSTGPSKLAKTAMLETTYAASFIQLNAGMYKSATKKRGGLAIGLTSWRKLPENEAGPLMEAAAEGPVAISVGASSWFFYGGGIFNNCQKDVVIDHAVTLFGYGTDTIDGKETNYWLVRNSWGKDWGENGFIRLFRHDTTAEDDGYCGQDTDPKSGLACKPYPKEVTVCGMCGILYDSVTANLAKK